MENFFDAEVYLQPPNDGLDSDEDSDSEEGTDPQHLSAGQLTAEADFRIDVGAHVADSFETEDFNNDLENKRSDQSKWLSKQTPPKCTLKWNKEDINNKFENVPPPQQN